MAPNTAPLGGALAEQQSNQPSTAPSADPTVVGFHGHHRSRTTQDISISSPGISLAPLSNRAQRPSGRHLRSSLSNSQGTPANFAATAKPASSHRLPTSPESAIADPDPERFLRLAAGVVKARQGSVLSRGSLLKTDYWASGENIPLTTPSVLSEIIFDHISLLAISNSLLILRPLIEKKVAHTLWPIIYKALPISGQQPTISLG